MDIPDIILFQRLPFYINYEMQAFIDLEYPDNKILFSDLNQWNGFHELLFDEDRRIQVSKGRQLKDFAKGVLIRIPREVHCFDGAEREGFVKEVNARAKTEHLGFRLAGEDIKKQISGIPPLLYLEKDVFKIIIKKAQAQLVEMPSRQFGLDNLKADGKSLDVLITWYITEQSAVTNWKVAGRHVKIRLPGLGIIDPYRSSKLLDESPVFRLIDHPLPMAIYSERIEN
ncbi:hypothetical protein SAMN05216464_113114 [Mucilaginibacter pineti]|uniref:Uncharacterized protein n=2 Tax=Mucilaginibacter pineti TaxID=1391627 RepID=A0A1G7IPJ6_9SPHI|nr:hypothetical protein SAMN05216464_113114 [Mucilaginibacter pineti]